MPMAKESSKTGDGASSTNLKKRKLEPKWNSDAPASTPSKEDFNSEEKAEDTEKTFEINLDKEDYLKELDKISVECQNVEGFEFCSFKTEEDMRKYTRIEKGICEGLTTTTVTIVSILHNVM